MQNGCASGASAASRLTRSDGRTPARAAQAARMVAEVDPDGSLTADERARRVASALRVRMTRVSMARRKRA
jgi:hypothetical protein